MRNLVIALGGNALLRKGQKPTFVVQMENVYRTARHLARTIGRSKDGIVITHGNGPQVGEEFLRNFYSEREVPRLPLQTLNAETQALIGSMLQLALLKEFRKMKSKKKVCVVVTHVLVDRNDGAFKKPTKPIGPFYSKKQLGNELSREKFAYVKVKGEYRRVVPSPMPKTVLEINEIKSLLKLGYIVICGGGGGVPVYRSDGGYIGVDGVIDKDRTTQLIANAIEARMMIILSDVDSVYWDFKRKRGPIKNVSAMELEKRIDSFENGTIKPKLEACVKFVKKGGKEARIGALDEFESVMEGRSGTTVKR